MGNPRDLERLVEHPREAPDCELKGWLDLDDARSAGTLAKACLALANSGGGYLMVGFEERPDGWTAVPSTTVDRFTQDLLNDVVKKYADPAFHVEVHHIVHPTTRARHPVVIVPGGHPVPIRCRRGSAENVVTENAYYIRRPGPASEMPRSAEEWSALVRRCVLADRDSLFRQLSAALAAPAETTVGNVPAAHDAWVTESKERFDAVQVDTYGSLDASPLKHGTWMASYSMEVRDEDMGLRPFRDRLRRCVGGETGWPIGLFLDRADKRSYSANGVIESWLGGSNADVGHADFWRASPSGHFATFRGYQDDEIVNERRPLGTCMDFVIFVWRIGEVLLHAMRFASEFADAGTSVQITVEWKGLKGRRLTNTSNRDRYHLHDNYRNRDDVVRASVHIDDAATIDINLSELVGRITRPLYEAFDFFELSKEIRDAELNRFRNRR
jgi:hypothetical protein